MYTHCIKITVLTLTLTLALLVLVHVVLSMCCSAVIIVLTLKYRTMSFLNCSGQILFCYKISRLCLRFIKGTLDDNNNKHSRKAALQKSRCRFRSLTNKPDVIVVRKDSLRRHEEGT